MPMSGRPSRGIKCRDSQWSDDVFPSIVRPLIAVFAACRSARSGGLGRASRTARSSRRMAPGRSSATRRPARRAEQCAMMQNVVAEDRPGDRPVGRGAAHRRQQGRDPARACPARRAAAQRARAQCRRQGYRPRLFRALLPGRLLCRSDPREAAARHAEDRHSRPPSSSSRRRRKASASRSTSRVSPTGFAALP